MTEKRAAQSAPSKGMPTRQTTRKVLALSIDEKIEWALGEVSLSGSVVCREKGILAPLSDAANGDQDIVIEAELGKALRQLKEDAPHLFQDIAAIGVSTIGVVNIQERRLISIARKRWKNKEGASLIDFQRLLFQANESDPPLFSPSGSYPALIVHNDVIARGLAEAANEKEVTGQAPESLFYLIFGEGVNGGVIYDAALTRAFLNPELGHVRPLPYPTDVSDFNPVTHGGCPAHGYCYEGIASFARARRSWGTQSDGTPIPGWTVDMLAPGHKAWDILGFYISQLCHLGVMAFAPRTILISGELLGSDEWIFRYIRHWFKELNAGYMYYDEMNDPSKFIRRAHFSVEDVRLKGALQLARSALLLT
jgi:hypothetical protein